jgi:hypothetical protein
LLFWLFAGTVKASNFQEVVLEQLAQSLLVLSEGSDAASARPQLAEYVLSTFVRRLLNRSHLRHISLEQAAINAVHLLRVGWLRTSGTRQCPML